MCELLGQSVGTSGTSCKGEVGCYLNSAAGSSSAGTARGGGGIHVRGQVTSGGRGRAVLLRRVRQAGIILWI